MEASQNGLKIWSKM